MRKATHEKKQLEEQLEEPRRETQKVLRVLEEPFKSLLEEPFMGQKWPESISHSQILEKRQYLDKNLGNFAAKSLIVHV